MYRQLPLDYCDTEENLKTRRFSGRFRSVFLPLISGRIRGRLLKIKISSESPWSDNMKRCLGLFLLVCCGMLHLGSGLRCYKCSDYTGRCQNVQECTYEDSCISLSERGGKTIRQCIRYTDCDNSRLSQMYPAISGFTYRCCSSNLCNSGITNAAPPVLALVLAVAGSLLSVWWFWV